MGVHRACDLMGGQGVADGSGVALHHVVRNGVVARDAACPSEITGVHMAAGKTAGGVGLEMTSAARRSAEGMITAAMETTAVEAASVKTAGMKTADAGMKTAAGAEAASTGMKAAAATMEAATTTAMEAPAAAAVEAAAAPTPAVETPTTAAATSCRLRHVGRHQPCDCACKDHRKRR